MAMVVWPYVAVGAVVIVAGAAMAIRGLFGDRSRGRRRCPKCWYDMAGLDTLLCPECGRTARNERKLLVARRRWWLILPALLLMAAGALCAGAPWLARAGWIASAPRPVLILAMYITDGPDARLRDEFDRRRTGAPPPPAWATGAMPVPLGASTGWPKRTLTGSFGALPPPATAPGAPFLPTNLSAPERWCVRKLAVALLGRSSTTTAPSTSQWWSWSITSDSRRPYDWLLWLGKDAAPAVDDLLAIVRGTAPAQHRVAAIDLLVRLGLRKQEVVAHLLTIAKSPGDAQVRVAAINALGAVGSLEEQNSPTVRALLRDEERTVRSAALGLLGKFLGPDAKLADEVIALVPREPDGALCHLMVSLIVLHVEGRCGQLREVYERIFRQHPHPPARAGALFGLRICSRNADELRAYAVEGMHDSDYLVRLQSLKAIMDLGPAGAPALDEVRALAADPQPTVAQLARDAARALEAPAPP